MLKWCLLALGSGRLNVKTVNNVWDEVFRMAQVKCKTPNSARHAMSQHIIEKMGNIAAVQQQLGHKNAAYSMQYARITGDELNGGEWMRSEPRLADSSRVRVGQGPPGVR